MRNDAWPIYMISRGGMTYILKLAAKGSKTITASAMPSNRPVAEPIPLRSVPADIRTAARARLLPKREF